ncbi:MAG TPA: response regulator transcription factor [Candidatus Limnocylindrales bacterium]
MRILVAEDDPGLRDVIVLGLADSGYHVDAVDRGDDAIDQLKFYEYDVAIIDWRMPGAEGIDVVAWARRNRRPTAILMLTARDAPADRIRGLDSGADDYLVKPFAYEELMARVRALLRRGTVRTPRLLSYSNLKLDLDTREVSRGERTVNLTAKEHELLEHLLRQPRRVFTRDQLLEGVWGIDSEAASNVVDVYVGYLRQKLEEGGEPRLVQTVRGVGYSLREE